jgi:hypothetical protein
MKILIWAAQNKKRGRMQPAGRQFDMPDLMYCRAKNSKCFRIFFIL